MEGAWLAAAHFHKVISTGQSEFFCGGRTFQVRHSSSTWESRSPGKDLELDPLNVVLLHPGSWLSKSINFGIRDSIRSQLNSNGWNPFAHRERRILIRIFFISELEFVAPLL